MTPDGRSGYCDVAERKIDRSLVLTVPMLAGLAFVVAMMVVPSPSAEARMSTCERLQAELAATSSGTSAGQLRRELAATRRQARRRGCNSFFSLFFRGRRSAQCPQIMSKLRRLRSEIGRGSGRRGMSRAQVLYQLRRHGCGAAPRDDDVRTAGRRKTRRGETVAANKTARGTHRTLCVRTCDGYYFPISNATTRSRFKIDEAACKGMYGGAPAELYVHPVESRADDAVSFRSKKPYRTEPFAFAYRLRFQPACQAVLHAGLNHLGRVVMDKAERKTKGKSNAKLEATPPEPPAATMPIPVPRIGASEDQETYANRKGGVELAPGDSKLAVLPDIRRVGPSYYYADAVKLEGLRSRPSAGDYGIIGPAHAGSGATAAQGGAENESKPVPPRKPL